MDDLDIQALTSLRTQVLDATKDAHVSPTLVPNLLRKRRVVRRVQAAGLVLALGATAGGIFAGVVMSRDSSVSRISPITSPTTDPQPTLTATAARIESVSLPAGYALMSTETSPVRTAAGGRTEVNLRYTPGGLPLALPINRANGELIISLDTGDVSAPDLASLKKSDEPTAHDVPLRPGTEVISARDDSAIGGLTYYMWFENGIFIEVTAIDGVVPDLASVVSSLRVSR